MEKLLQLFVTNEMIYSFYFEEYSLKGKFHSPFRYDPKPSLSFKNIGTYKNPLIIWNDFGMTDIRKDGIGFVMEMFYITREQAIEKIWKEMVLDEEVPLERPNVKIPVNLPYVFRYKEFDSQKELTYWEDLFFTESLLQFLDIKVLRQMVRGNKIMWKWKDENPTYLYLFEGDARKAYRPLDPDGDKFRGQENGDVIEGYDKLPRSGDTLFIDSSYKDTGCMRVMGSIAINPTSENSYNAILRKRRELNSRFDNIYILFDNDDSGIKSAKRLKILTGWQPIFLPPRYGKDQSEHVRKYGNYFGLLNVLPNFKKHHYGKI